MHRFIRLLSLLLALPLIVGLAGPISAQEDGAGVNPEVQEAQGEGTVEANPTGILQITAWVCESTDGSTGVALLTPVEFVPGAGCVESAAALTIDGVDYGAAAPLLEVVVDATWHTVVATDTGAARELEVFADSVTALSIVSFSIPETTPTPEPTAESAEAPTITTASLTLITHVCEPAVQSSSDLFALGGRDNRFATCPAMTLPGNAAPGGVSSSGEAWFDYLVQPGAGGAFSLAEADFLPGQRCESDAGADLNRDPADNACFDTSGYRLEVPAGAGVVQLTQAPPQLRFGGAEASLPADDATIGGVDPGSWSFSYDTSLATADGGLAVHVYLLSPPQVAVSIHRCPATISSAEALASQGGFAQLLACPADFRPADGGGLDLNVTVTGADGVSRELSAATPETESVCESQLGADVNGDPTDNACYEFPRYTLTGVPQGGVTVLPASTVGLNLGAVGFVPGSGNEGTLVAFDATSGLVALDTSFDGDVWVHLFFFEESVEEPEATATAQPTSTPVPKPSQTPRPDQSTGTLRVVALYCLGSTTQTTLTALPPGQQAGSDLLGGSSCFAGDSQVRVELADARVLGPFGLGRDGVESYDNLPVTGGGLHRLVEVFSGRTTTFEIAAGSVTRVILRVEVAQGISDSGLAASGGGNGGANGGGGASGGLSLDGMVVDELLSGALVTDTLLPGNIIEGGGGGGDYFAAYVAGDLESLDLLAIDLASELPAVGSGSLTSSPQRGLPEMIAALASVAMASLALGLRRRRAG